MHSVRKIDVGRGLLGGGRKKNGWGFPGRPQSYLYQRRPVDDYSSEQEEWCKAPEQGAESFMAKLITAEKDRAGQRYAVVRPNVTGRTKERISQSKRARAGLLTVVD